ncbi:MAG: aminoglycoside phosphotransferase family protein, partial [Candidatus Paceibacterales bacterium]
MNTFLDDKGQMSKEDVTRIASGCLQQEVEVIAKIGRGGNSKVYHVAGPSQQYVVKFYFKHPSDSRDRLGIEYKSLSFLWEQGLRVIPRPVAFSEGYQCAFYEFIKGTPPGKDISKKDIDGAVYFLEILRNLSAQAEDINFSGASEAFFCARDIVNSLRARLKRFYFEDNSSEYLALREYLQNEFLPLLEAVEMWSKEYLTGQGVLWEKELLEEYRTLSPSDFGFHNALRTSAGSMVFLDFEYFGWDDPTKLVSDFLWHPAMGMPEDIKMYFVNRMAMVFGNDPYFKARLKSVFPLFGLKWCLILLNEFTPTASQRRDFAGLQIKDKGAVRLEQL